MLFFYLWYHYFYLDVYAIHMNVTFNQINNRNMPDLIQIILNIFYFNHLNCLQLERQITAGFCRG